MQYILNISRKSHSEEERQVPMHENDAPFSVTCPLALDLQAAAVRHRSAPHRSAVVWCTFSVFALLVGQSASAA